VTLSSPVAVSEEIYGRTIIAPATATTARIRTIRRVVKNIQCSSLARQIIELKLY
jgi:hypothetical protein